MRSLLRHPGFFLLATLPLALGIALTTALSSVAEAILLRPLPVAKPSEILRIFTVSPSQPFGFVSYPDFQDLLHAPAISGAVAQTQVLVAIGDPPKISMGLAVTANYFDVLGVPAALGRTFRNSENRDAVVLLAHSFWESQFASDKFIVGRSLRMGGENFQVIGVAPKDFGLERFAHEQFYVPMGVYETGLLPSTGHPLEDRAKRFLTIYARARPEAQAEIPALAARLELQYPDTNRGRRAIVLSEFESRLRTDKTLPALTALLATIAALIAIIAAANLTGLIMLRHESRSREIAIKIALGATRLRLLRETILESAVLASIASALGTALASISLRLLSSLATLPTDMPFSLAPHIDPRLVIFLTLAIALVCGCAPAISRHRNRWRNSVVAAEIAIATTITVLGAMHLQTILTAGRTNLGYRTDHILVLALDPAQLRYDETRTRAFYDQLLDRVRHLPGIEAAALAQSIPLGYTGAQRQIEILGDEASRDQDRLTCWMNLSTPGYFEILRMPLLAGRAFDDRDTAQSPPVAIINEALAKYFRGSALHRRMRISGRTVEVVGIVPTAKYFTLGEAPKPFFYLPYSQNYASRMVLHIKSSGDLAKQIPAVITAIRSVDASQPISEIRALDDYFSKGALFTARLGARVLTAVAACALLLAMAGLFGIVSQMVARRRREIGMRIALGAPPRTVVVLVTLTGIRLAVIGIALGSVAAWWASRFIDGPKSPWTFLVAAVLILAATIAACWIPARRASSIDPSVALRES